MHHVPKCFRFSVLSQLIAKVMIIVLFFVIGGIDIAGELNMSIIEALWLILLNENNVLAFTILHYLTYAFGLFFAATVYYEKKVEKLLKKIRVL